MVVGESEILDEDDAIHLLFKDGSTCLAPHVAVEHSELLQNMQVRAILLLIWT